MQKSRWIYILMAIFLVIFISGGIYTLARQILAISFPLALFMDYNFYSQALTRALSGGDMYAVREIGLAYLYPPPALLFVDALHIIPDDIAQGALFAALDILMAASMVYLICKKYSVGSLKTILLVTSTLTYAPFLITAQLGQINMLTQFGLGLLFIFAFTLPWLAGLGLALAIVTKMTPLFFLAYLVATKNLKVLMWTAVSLLVFSLLAALRYGTQSFLTYLDVFHKMTGVLPLGANSQAVSVRLTALWQVPDIGAIQLGITLYLLVIIMLSAWQTFRGGPPEAMFSITALAMMLSPNILWYHHYIFVLLPLIVWIAWQRGSIAVILWCLTGMLIIQFDYFLLTGGLLIHIFGHLSILILFFQSVPKPKRIEAQTAS